MGTSAAIALAVALTLSGGALVSAEELFTTRDAVESLASADPTAVGTDASQQAAGAPEVQEQAAGFDVESASVDATIPKDAAAPIVLETSSGELKLTAQDVSAGASTGEAVNDGAAVVYANTGRSSDTSVVPLEEGIETFTNIRGEDASENYSVKVALPGAEEIKQVDDDTVVVIDPTPAPRDQELPAPAEPGSAQADAARASSSADAPVARIGAQADAVTAASHAGAHRPADLDDDDVRSIDVPGEEAAARLAQAPSDMPTPEGPPSREALEQRAATVDAAVKATAQASLAQAAQLGADAARKSNERNADTAADQPVVVATIEAPQSLDAAGRRIPTELRVDGDVVTMHVDHQDATVEYPIAADPIIQIVVVKFRLAWYPTFREETYVSHWAKDNAYVGTWHPAYCAMGMQCAHAGAGWWGVHHNGGEYIAYWPSWDWGPVWQPYWYPVYATRLVIDSWVPYWEPYLDVEDYDTDRLSVFDEGGDLLEEYDAAYDEDASLVQFVASRVPNCRRVRRASGVYDSIVGRIGAVRFTTRYCWSRERRKTSYATGSMNLDTHLGLVAQAAGFNIAEGDSYKDSFAWEGGNGMRMWKDFDLQACTYLIHLACLTTERYEYVVRGYWNGDYGFAMKRR